MPNLYARQTALTNVVGRIDYISNPKRQEHLLAVCCGADTAFWRQLALECALASKHKSPGTKSVQGRELCIQLANSLLKRMTPEEIAKTLKESFEKKYGRPCTVAIHMNKKGTNLHAHLIYAERELLPEPVEKVAPRALFFDETGARRYKKAEILDENGEVRAGCRIVAKGEVYERRCFGAVDPVFSSKAWLRTAKMNWLLPLRNDELKGDVEITAYDKNSGMLAQQHVGKGLPAEIEKGIVEYNTAVKEYNEYVQDGTIGQDDALKISADIKAKPRKNFLLVTFLTKLAAALGRKREQAEPKKKGLDSIIKGAENSAQGQRTAADRPHGRVEEQGLDH